MAVGEIYGLDDLGYDGAVVADAAYDCRRVFTSLLDFEHLATCDIAVFWISQVGVEECFISAEAARWVKSVDNCVVQVCRVRAFSEEDGYVVEIDQG